MSKRTLPSFSMCVEINGSLTQNKMTISLLWLLILVAPGIRHSSFVFFCPREDTDASILESGRTTATAIYATFHRQSHSLLRMLVAVDSVRAVSIVAEKNRGAWRLLSMFWDLSFSFVDGNVRLLTRRKPGPQRAGCTEKVVLFNRSYSLINMGYTDGRVRVTRKQKKRPKLSGFSQTSRNKMTEIDTRGKGGIKILSVKWKQTARKSEHNTSS